MVSCAACGCSKTPKNTKKGITFHRFPKDVKKRKLWMLVMNEPDKWLSTNCFLCSKHFSSDSFDRTSNLIVRLFPYAVPTIKVLRLRNTEEEYVLKLAEKRERILAQRELQLAEHRNRLNAENNIRLAKREEHLEASRKPNLFVTPGIISESERIETNLKSEPDDDFQVTENISQLNEPVLSEYELLQPKTEYVHIVNDHCYDNISNILELFDPIYTYNKLKADLHNIILPHYWQCIDAKDGSLLVYLGDSRRHVSKSIFFHEDMRLEIRAEGRIVHPDFVQKITCLDDVIKLMTTMSNLKICAGFNGENECTKGFISPYHLGSKRCDECRKKGNLIRRRLATQEKRIKRANSIEHKKTLRKLKKRMKRREDSLILKNNEIHRLKLLLKGEEKKVDYYVGKYLQISRLNKEVVSNACLDTS